ncbi:DUF2182 domain-containing protein [Arthrobacter mobilis]|nr:DUF2182 domain-containing protein [Arthrobacter mobilis]
MARIDPREAALVAVLLALAGGSWISTATRMNGMDMGRWTDPGPPAFFLTTWVIMLAAMMCPSVAPMVVAYVRIHRRRKSGRYAPYGCTAVFVAGYLAAWTLFGTAAYVLYVSAAALFPGFLASEPGGRYLAAGVVLAAAAYQLTGAKDICLMKCRTPVDFILHRMRHGYFRALRMGAEHGAWCVGCCWALMVALFPLGMMNVGWMALVGAFIAAEKMLPWKRLASRSVAAAPAAAALAIALVPAPMPAIAG